MSDGVKVADMVMEPLTSSSPEGGSKAKAGPDGPSSATSSNRAGISPTFSNTSGVEMGARIKTCSKSW